MGSVGSKVVIKVDCRLDIDNSRKLKVQLTDVFEQGAKNVELDFSETESVDSSGLGKILLFSEKFKDAGGGLKIANVNNSKVAQLFRLINLDKFINIEYKS
jgi:anti-sigma B factor antagonist